MKYKKDDTKKEVEYVHYEKALTDNEILEYVQIIDDFKMDKIDCEELKNKFLEYGINITYQVDDNRWKHIRLRATAEQCRERLLTGNYKFGDVNGYIMNGNGLENVLLKIDYKAIEVMANAGFPEYQKILIGILKTQILHSYNINAEIAAERRKMRQRVAELEEELAKTNNNNHNFKL